MLNPKRFDVSIDKSCEDENKPPPATDDAVKELADQPQDPTENQRSTKDAVSYLPNEEVPELANIFHGEKCDVLQSAGGPVSPYTLPITSPISTASDEASNMEAFGNESDKDSPRHIKQTLFPPVNFASLISPNKEVLSLGNSESVDRLVLEHKTHLNSLEISSDSQNANCGFPVVSSDINNSATNNLSSDRRETCTFSASSLVNCPDSNSVESDFNSSMPCTPTFQSGRRSAFSSVDQSPRSPVHSPYLSSNLSCYFSCDDPPNKPSSAADGNGDNKENDAPVLTSDPLSASCNCHPVDKLTVASSPQCSIEMAPTLEELSGNFTGDKLPAVGIENGAQSDDSVPALTAENRENSLLYTIERASPGLSDNGMELECDNFTDQDNLDTETCIDSGADMVKHPSTADTDCVQENGNTHGDNSSIAESAFETITKLCQQEKTHDEYDDIPDKELSVADIPDVGPTVAVYSEDSEVATRDSSSTCEYSIGGVEAETDGDMCIKIVDVAGGVAFTESDNSSDSCTFGQSVSMLSGKSLPTLVAALHNDMDNCRRTNPLSCSDQLLHGTSNTAVDEVTSMRESSLITEATDPRSRWLHDYMDHLGNNPEAIASLRHGNLDRNMQNRPNNLTSLLKATVEPLLVGSPVRSEGGVRVKTMPFSFTSVTSNPTWTLPTQSITNSLSPNPQYALSQMLGAVETTTCGTLNMGYQFAGALPIHNTAIENQQPNKRPLLYVNNLGMVVQSPVKKLRLMGADSKDVETLTPVPLQPVMMMQNIHNSVSNLPAVLDVQGKGSPYTTGGDTRRLSSGFEILVENAEECLAVPVPIQTVPPAEPTLQVAMKKKKKSHKKKQQQSDKQKRDLTNMHSLRDGTTGRFLPAENSPSKSILSKLVNNKLKTKMNPNSKGHKNASFHSHSSSSKNKKNILSKSKAVVRIKHRNKVKKEDKHNVSDEKKRTLPNKKSQVDHKNDKKRRSKSETKKTSVKIETEIKSSEKVKAVSIPKIVHPLPSPVIKVTSDVPEAPIHKQSVSISKRKGRPIKWRKRLKLGTPCVNKAVQPDTPTGLDKKTVKSDSSPESGKKNVKSNVSPESGKTLKHNTKTRENIPLHQFTLARQLEDADELIVNTERGAKLVAQERLNVYSEYT